MSKILKHRSMFRFLLLALSMLALSTAQSRAAADNRYVQARITLVQLEPPRQEILPVAENTRCANYAQDAVDDYKTMRRHQECVIPDDPRWQPNYQNHYQWCLTARREWLVSEKKARDGHLVRCGVRKNY